jgi:hypothetical protein
MTLRVQALCSAFFALVQLAANSSYLQTHTTADKDLFVGDDGDIAHNFYLDLRLG